MVDNDDLRGWKHVSNLTVVVDRCHFHVKCDGTNGAHQFCIKLWWSIKTHPFPK